MSCAVTPPHFVAEQDEVLESLQRLTQSLRSGEDADAAHKERGSMEASYTALENKVWSTHMHTHGHAHTRTHAHIVCL